MLDRQLLHRESGSTVAFHSSLICLDVSQAQITPRAIKAIGWRYYICFAVMSATNALTIYLFFPETKGVSLEGESFYKHLDQHGS